MCVFNSASVCPAIAFQYNLEQEMNNSCYVLQADLPLNKTAIICQAALGKELIPQGNEYRRKMLLVMKVKQDRTTDRVLQLTKS